jgi:hypothetical protein
MADHTNLHRGQPREPAARAEIQTYIGRQLRAVYDEIVNEPIPDNLVRLLEDLERKKPGGS